MKKYNKPEIEALALETVDVIAASATSVLTQEAVAKAVTGTTQSTDATLAKFDTTWQW